MAESGRKSRGELFHEKYPFAAEIIRFLLVGGLATAVDMLTMALVQFILQSSLYASFWDIFTAKGEGYVYVLGTACGFLVGLAVNYCLSVLFVFEEKGNSRSPYGFFMFALLSAVGFALHTVGMLVGNTLLHVNAWIVKIVMTLTVLVWNYLSRKRFLFKKENKGEEGE